MFEKSFEQIVAAEIPLLELLSLVFLIVVAFRGVLKLLEEANKQWNIFDEERIKEQQELAKDFNFSVTIVFLMAATIIRLLK